MTEQARNNSGAEPPAMDTGLLYSETTRRLLQGWFPGAEGAQSVNQDEVAKYLKRKGFKAVMEKRRGMGEVMSFYRGTNRTRGIIGIQIYMRDGKIHGVHRRGANYQSPRYRSKSRRQILRRMAEREGREPYS